MWMNERLWNNSKAEGDVVHSSSNYFFHFALREAVNFYCRCFEKMAILKNWPMDSCHGVKPQKNNIAISVADELACNILLW